MTDYDPSEYISNLEDLKWLSVDLDGNVAENIWPERGIGKPIPMALNYYREMAEKGYKLWIHTSRSWEDYEGIERWCRDFDLPISGIVPGKFLARRYDDDRAFKPPWVDEL